MSTENCQERARTALVESDHSASVGQRQRVAREMCRLLDSGILEEDLERDSADIDYLVSRLNVREGKDNPDIETKWNHWLGSMNYLANGNYKQFQV